MVSPGTAGLSGVTAVLAALAQQSTLLVGVRTREIPVVLVEVVVVVAAKVMPLPSGPGTLACRRMRVNTPAGKAFTCELGSALIRAMKASRMVTSVSVASTV